MPFYHKLGEIPPKRHTQFRKKDGSLYYEQLFGTIGFDGMSTMNTDQLWSKKFASNIP
jgi:homogentisate 1,2-dioxygenase